MTQGILEFDINKLQYESRKFFNKLESEEITNGEIAKYMLLPREIGGLGLDRYRSTIYRKLKSGNTRFSIRISNNYQSELSYEEKVKLAQDYLRKNKFSSGDTITYEEILKMSEYCGLTPRQLGIKVLKIDEAIISALINGKRDCTTIELNGKYDNLALKEKVQEVKQIFVAKFARKDITYEEIKMISEKFNIPIKTFITNVLHKDALVY